MQNISVLSVGRRYARIATSSIDKVGEQYDLEDNSYKADCNSWYKFFDEELEAQEYINIKEKYSEIRQYLQINNNDLNSAQVEQIHKIIFKKEGEHSGDN